MKQLLFCLWAFFLVVAFGCAESRSGRPSVTQTTLPPSSGSRMLLFNMGSIPGTYARCGVDNDTIPNRIRTDEYIEYPVPGGPGTHRVECSVETLSVPVSFSCRHAFETFGSEKIYLAIRGTGLPGTCSIERLSVPPEGYFGKYQRATQPN